MRVEVEAALHLERPIIPVLVQNAAVPGTDELSVTIRPLVELNALSVRSDPDFHGDMEKLIATLREMKVESPVPSVWYEQSSTYNPSTFMQEGERFTATGRFRFKTATGTLSMFPGQNFFLRIIPRICPKSIRSSMDAVELVNSGHLSPMADSGSYFLRSVAAAGFSGGGPMRTAT